MVWKKEYGENRKKKRDKAKAEKLAKEEEERAKKEKVRTRKRLAARKRRAAAKAAKDKSATIPIVSEPIRVIVGTSNPNALSLSHGTVPTNPNVLPFPNSGSIPNPNFQPNASFVADMTNMGGDIPLESELAPFQPQTSARASWLEEPAAEHNWNPRPDFRLPNPEDANHSTEPLQIMASDQHDPLLHLE